MRKQDTQNQPLTASQLRTRMENAKQTLAKQPSEEQKYKTKLKELVKREQARIEDFFTRNWASELLTAADKGLNYTDLEVGISNQRCGTLAIEKEAILICGVEFLNKLGYKTKVTREWGKADVMYVKIRVEWSSE